MGRPREIDPTCPKHGADFVNDTDDEPVTCTCRIHYECGLPLSQHGYRPPRKGESGLQRVCPDQDDIWVDRMKPDPLRERPHGPANEDPEDDT